MAPLIDSFLEYSSWKGAITRGITLVQCTVRYKLHVIDGNRYDFERCLHYSFTLTYLAMHTYITLPNHLHVAGFPVVAL